MPRRRYPIDWAAPRHGPWWPTSSANESEAPKPFSRKTQWQPSDFPNAAGIVQAAKTTQEPATHAQKPMPGREQKKSMLPHQNPMPQHDSNHTVPPQQQQPDRQEEVDQSTIVRPPLYRQAYLGKTCYRCQRSLMVGYFMDDAMRRQCYSCVEKEADGSLLVRLEKITPEQEEAMRGRWGESKGNWREWQTDRMIGFRRMEFAQLPDFMRSRPESSYEIGQRYTCVNVSFYSHSYEYRPLTPRELAELDAGKKDTPELDVSKAPAANDDVNEKENVQLNGNKFKEAEEQTKPNIPDAPKATEANNAVNGEEPKEVESMIIDQIVITGDDKARPNDFDFCSSSEHSDFSVIEESAANEEGPEAEVEKQSGGLETPVLNSIDCQAVDVTLKSWEMDVAQQTTDEESEKDEEDKQRGARPASIEEGLRVDSVFLPPPEQRSTLEQSAEAPPTSDESYEEYPLHLLRERIEEHRPRAEQELFLLRRYVAALEAAEKVDRPRIDMHDNTELPFQNIVVILFVLFCVSFTMTKFALLLFN